MVVGQIVSPKSNTFDPGTNKGQETYDILILLSVMRDLRDLNRARNLLPILGLTCQRS